MLAKKRQATSTGGKTPQLTPNLAEGEKGETRDIVAKKVGLRSGHEVERAINAVESIDKLSEVRRIKNGLHNIRIL